MSAQHAGGFWNTTHAHTQSEGCPKSGSHPRLSVLTPTANPAANVTIFPTGRLLPGSHTGTVLIAHLISCFCPSPYSPAQTSSWRTRFEQDESCQPL